jgi:pyrrolidone-carboxylate peptidase
MASPRPDVIVTAFEPFGGRTVNRSWEIVTSLPDVPGIEKVQLPVDYAKVRTLVPELVARAGRALIMLGEAGRGGPVDVERIGTNIADADIPDNGGAQPRGEELVPGAPLARYARWDAHAVAATLSAAGVSVEVSHHAGTYLCNAALFLALEAAERGPAPATIGFLHVPVETPPETPVLVAGISRLLLTFR